MNIYNKINNSNLSVQKAVNKVDKNFVFETKKFSHPSGNPWLHNVHLDFCHVHLKHNIVTFAIKTTKLTSHGCPQKSQTPIYLCARKITHPECFKNLKVSDIQCHCWCFYIYKNYTVTCCLDNTSRN